MATRASKEPALRVLRRRLLQASCVALAVMATGPAGAAVVSARCKSERLVRRARMSYCPPVFKASVGTQTHGARLAGARSSRRMRPGRALRRGNIDASSAAVVRTARTTMVPGSAYVPNDYGTSHEPGGWRKLQWNFLANAGVNAPAAWAELVSSDRPGARGVRIAVLDTGIAYRNWHGFRQDPELASVRFAAPYDFIAHNRYPVDRNGHGTFVTSEIAEATDNRIGLTGLAYNATIIPVRVLNAEGWGSAATIARGVRYAVAHGAQVINLSLEFSPQLVTRADEIGPLTQAIRFALHRNVAVVAATGDDSAGRVAYPGALPGVIAAGATTRDRCLATYSNYGQGVSLVAPGGGPDARIPGDPSCRPGRRLPPIYQMTVYGYHLRHYGYPSYYVGTSMAAAEVSAVAAMVIASFAHERPSVRTVRSLLETTAHRLGPRGRVQELYGAGLLDAASAVQAAENLTTARPFWFRPYGG